MLRFTVLGSGSTGNATLIEGHERLGVTRPTRVLVDCGLTLRELKRRLAERGLDLDDIDAVYVTHEHSDHVGCLASLIRKHHIPVWTSVGTWRGSASRVGDLPPPPTFARDGEAIVIGALELQPYAVPHDAREPLQLVIGDGNHKLGIATDFGESTPRVIDALSGCDALMLESNHDEHMLATGPYPASLRRRIAGRFGHLANTQASRLLGLVQHDRLGLVVAAHLSLHNNAPDIARASFAKVLSRSSDEVHVADPVNGTGWLSV